MRKLFVVGNVDGMVRRVMNHFGGHATPDIHVGAPDNPFQRLRSAPIGDLKAEHWLCRHSPSNEVTESTLACLGKLGLTIDKSDGWKYVYAFKRMGGDET